MRISIEGAKNEQEAGNISPPVTDRCLPDRLPVSPAEGSNNSTTIHIRHPDSSRTPHMTTVICGRSKNGFLLTHCVSVPVELVNDPRGTSVAAIAALSSLRLMVLGSIV